MAYTALGAFTAALNSADFRERAQLSALLSFVQNAVTKPFQRLPAPSAAFAAEASLLLLSPGGVAKGAAKARSVEGMSSGLDGLARSVSKLLMRQPAMPIDEVPLMHKLLLAGGPRHRGERTWMLQMLWMGLRVSGVMLGFI